MNIQRPNPEHTRFIDPPPCPPLKLAWPTLNKQLFSAPDHYFARTRANPLYGMPGWTRECGQRFHRGCDIAPIRAFPTGKTITIQFTDCATGSEYPSEEPTWIPEDDVFAVFGGKVAEVQTDDRASNFGRHIIIQHKWPDSNSYFYSLYAHLEFVLVRVDECLASGQHIGRMGQTSNSVMGRDFMAIAPHLHVEFWDEQGQAFDPAEMLRRFIPRNA